MNIKSLIRTIPDYPKKGILFRDITTLLENPEGFRSMIDQLAAKYKNQNIDIIAGIEARGFVVGAALAYALNKGFVTVRKKGKLPGETFSQDYQLEYGTDTIEIHKDAIKKGQNVLIVDDLLATGGTAIGAVSLVEKVGGIVTDTCFIVDLPALKGGEKLKERNISYFALCEFEGD